MSLAVALSPLQDRQETLGLWQAVLLSLLREKLPDLSTRQLSVLLQVGLAPPPHTVRGLAAVLTVSKPAVSRALDHLADLGFVQRQRDQADRRNVLVSLRPEGAAFLERLAQLIERER